MTSTCHMRTQRGRYLPEGQVIQLTAVRGSETERRDLMTFVPRPSPCHCLGLLLSGLMHVTHDLFIPKSSSPLSLSEHVLITTQRCFSYLVVLVRQKLVPHSSRLCCSVLFSFSGFLVCVCPHDALCSKPGVMLRLVWAFVGEEGQSCLPEGAEEERRRSGAAWSCGCFTGINPN